MAKEKKGANRKNSDEERMEETRKELQEESEIEEIVSEVVEKEIKKKEKQEQKIEELQQVLEEAKGKKKTLPVKTEETVKQLDALKEAMKEKKQLPEEELLKTHERIFFNLGFAVVISIYFLFMYHMFFLLEQTVFLKELRLFSCGFLMIALVLFESAYKKDSGRIAITGIEFLALAICSMILIYVDTIFHDKFYKILPTVIMLFNLYFVGKGIGIYLKDRKTYFMKNMKNEIKKD